MSQRSAKKSHATVQDTVLYELTDYDRQRRPQTLIDDDRVQCVPADPVLKSLSCPICLDLFTRTMVTTTCLHRFCSDCIARWLKSENKVCPTCRKALKSKRYLRSDTLTDALIVVVKEQQAKTTQLATSFREQQRCEND